TLIDTEKKLGPEGSPVTNPTLYRCPATHRYTSGYFVFLGDNLLTWSSKRQDTLSCSSAEAEYCGVANAVAETSWIRNLLRKLHTPLFTATLVYYDNISAVYMGLQTRISSISIGSSDVQPSESPYLPVLFIGTSQSRQHDKSESVSYYLTD
ncbi:ribonuclease H-like domain-containing protein, partial [Tanacetum coccineum]